METAYTNVKLCREQYVSLLYALTGELPANTSNIEYIASKILEKNELAARLYGFQGDIRKQITQTAELIKQNLE